MNAERPPVHWLTYNGDCRGILNEGPKGPTLFGEYVWPVGAEYDGERTRVGFSYVAPPEFAAARFNRWNEQRGAAEAARHTIAERIQASPEVLALLTPEDDDA